MRRGLGWVTVVVLCCAAGALAGEKQPDARLLETRKAFEEVVTLYRAGRYAEAIAPCERALRLQEAALGSTHPEIVGWLDILGGLYWMQGDFDRAEPLLERALTIREAGLGKDHPDVAASLHNLALFRLAQ